MKVKRLFVCETIAQIVNVLNIQYHTPTDADVCLCNHHNNMVSFSEKLKDAKLFRAVYVFNANFDTNQSIDAKIRKAIRSSRLVQTTRDILPNRDVNYDEIFISGPSSSCVGCYYFFKKRNKNLVLNLYEEGVYEYYMFNSKGSYCRRIYSKLFYGRYYLDECSKLYVYKPELVDCCPKSVKIVKIPKLTDKQLVEILNEVFDFKFDELSNIKKAKCIVLEQAFPTDYENLMQKSLLEETIRVVGRENIVVKMHPASPVDKYDDLDVNCLKTKYSMELIQANLLCEDIVLISICSSAVFNYWIMFGFTPHIVLQYKLFKSVTIKDSLKQFMKKFKDVYPGNLINVPESKEEFISVLKRL